MQFEVFKRPNQGANRRRIEKKLQAVALRADQIPNQIDGSQDVAGHNIPEAADEAGTTASSTAS